MGQEGERNQGREPSRQMQFAMTLGSKRQGMGESGSLCRK